MLVHIEENEKVYKNVSLQEGLQAKQDISARVGDFDIDCIFMVEETEVNMMTKETWKIMGKPCMVPSLAIKDYLRER